MPTLVLSLAVTIGTIPQFTPNKQAYYLLGLLVAGYSSYAIAHGIKKEAINRIEL